MFDISIRSDLDKLSAQLTGVARRQVPFAMAQTVTGVARAVATAERDNFAKTFDRPSPFTMNGIGVIPATKASLTAVVFVKDIQAAYLLPYEVGGPQVLGRKQAMLTPRDIRLNTYGNIPRNRIASLKGKPDVFVGTVKFKTGKEISGVWERGERGRQRGRRGRRTGRYGGKGLLNDYGVGQKTTLTLLVQFTRPAQVTHPLHYRAHAAKVAAASIPLQWNTAITKALATAR